MKKFLKIRETIEIFVTVWIDPCIAKIILLPPVGHAVLIEIVCGIGGKQIEAEKFFELADVSDCEVLGCIWAVSPRIIISVTHCNHAIVEWLSHVLELPKVYRSEIVSLRVGLAPAVNEVMQWLARAPA